MKNLQTFEEFLNEANLSTEVLKFKRGDAVVLNKDLDTRNLDFKKSALTWWGSNIGAIMNTWSKEYSAEGRLYKKGDILFIFTENGILDDKGLGVIYGYQGGFDMHSTKLRVSEYSSMFKYDEYQTQLIILALLNNYATIVNYSKLNDNFKEMFELSIAIDKITSHILKKDEVTYENMLVNEYEWSNNSKIILKGFDLVSGNELPRKLVGHAELSKNVKINGKNIKFDPFTK